MTIKDLDELGFQKKTQSRMSESRFNELMSTKAFDNEMEIKEFCLFGRNKFGTGTYPEFTDAYAAANYRTAEQREARRFTIGCIITVIALIVIFWNPMKDDFKRFEDSMPKPYEYVTVKGKSIYYLDVDYFDLSDNGKSNMLKKLKSIDEANCTDLYTKYCDKYGILHR